MVVIPQGFPYNDTTYPGRYPPELAMLAGTPPPRWRTAPARSWWPSSSSCSGSSPSTDSTGSGQSSSTSPRLGWTTFIVLHFLWECSGSVSNNTTQCSRGFFVLINSINCIVLALITMIIGSLFVVLYKNGFSSSGSWKSSRLGLFVPLDAEQMDQTPQPDQTPARRGGQQHFVSLQYNSVHGQMWMVVNVQFQSSKIYLPIVYPPITLWKYNP